MWQNDRHVAAGGGLDDEPQLLRVLEFEPAGLRLLGHGFPRSTAFRYPGN